MRKRLAIAAVVGVLALTGCGSDPEKSDAPDVPRDRIKPGTNTAVVLMPDGFRNVIFTCHGTVGLYVTSRGWNQAGTKDFPSLPSDVTAVPNHPMCGGN